MMEGENIQVVPRNNAEHLRIMIAAVDAVISGSMSQREAAKAYSIPRSTLRSHLPRHEVYKHRITKTPPNFKGKTILSKKEEKELVDYIINMHRAGFGRTRQDLLYKVQDVLNKSERKTKFENNLPNDEWYEAFLERHKANIQQCSFGSDMQEIGLIPIDVHSVNHIIETAVQSVSVHSDNIYHDDIVTQHNVIHHHQVDNRAKSLVKCESLPFHFQL
uniref:HTH psq-type domain-containing protein n=1 Tax=Arion vulgaris TaxID=1028688 RepID=A0A0B7B587_9EUPU